MLCNSDSVEPKKYKTFSFQKSIVFLFSHLLRSLVHLLRKYYSCVSSYDWNCLNAFGNNGKEKTHTENLIYGRGGN